MSVTPTVLALLRAPVLTAMTGFFAVLLLAGAAFPIDRYRAYAERHDRPFDEGQQRTRRLAGGALGVGFLLLAVAVTLI